MKTKNLFSSLVASARSLVLSAAIAMLNLIPAGRVAAQTFTTLKSFGVFTNITGFNPQSTLVQGPDGTLYGTASGGEGPVAGTLFKMQPDGSGFTVLKWFTNSIEGASPRASLALSGSTLYGTTSQGGNSGNGTLFKLNTDGTSFSTIYSFTALASPSPTNSDGASPEHAGLTVSGSALYGTTTRGGKSGSGVLFRVNTDGTGFTNLHNFAALNPNLLTNSDGASPDFGLTLSGSTLYGTTMRGGRSGAGSVFKVNTDGTGFTVLKHFTNSPDGANPYGGLTLSGSALYGTTSHGGSGDGTVFKLNTNGTDFGVLRNFTYSDGLNPSGNLGLSGDVLYGTTSYAGSSDVGTLFKVNTDGTGFNVLWSFANYPDGANPQAGVIVSGTALYGTTSSGGLLGGRVFKVNTDGTGYTVFKNFNYSDGNNPYGTVTVSGSDLYGTTEDGGSSAVGTLFTLKTDGTGYTVLKNFTGSDGANPLGSLALSSNILYGSTAYGGSSNYGTVFKANTDGTGYTVVKDFTGSPDGEGPGGLILSAGVLYGMTYAGGSSNYGTVFKVNTDGTDFSVLKSFAGGTSDGSYPYAGLTLSGDVLYGTTFTGGSLGYGTVFKLHTDGTGFSVLKSFNYNDDGSPTSALTLSGGVLYGSSYGGGSSRDGVLFRVNTDGTGFTNLHSFTRRDPFSLTNSDGANPSSEALVLSGGVLYGTAAGGGNWGAGTVFRLNTDGSGFIVLRHLTRINGVTGINADGSYPNAGLTLSGNALYGTTASGGSFGDGTLFSLSWPAPQLAITSAGPNTILSWPARLAGFDYAGYTLQSSANVGSTSAWTANVLVPVIVDGQNVVTNPLSSPQQFYRLVHP